MKCAIMQSALLVAATSQMWAQQQPVGQWRNYTDMKAVRSVAVKGDSVWAATGGGLFGYDLLAGQFSKFTNSDGLGSNDAGAVAVDASGAIWIGASDGSIDVLDAQNSAWLHISDIRQSTRIQRAIQSFLPLGDTMLIVSDFGVSVYRRSRREFGDTYATFGFASAPHVRRTIVQAGRIWVGTDQGLASASLSSSNLSSPTSWSLYGTSSGLPSSVVTSLSIFHDTLMVGTSSGLAYLVNNAFQSAGAFAGVAVADLFSTGGQLYVLSNGSGGFTVQSLGALTSAPLSAGGYPATGGSSLAVMSTAQGPSTVVVGSTTVGLVLWNGASWIPQSPNGPQSNQFVSLTVDDNGVLWAASGLSNGTGFYRFDPSRPPGLQWKNFTAAKYPIMRFDNYFKVLQGSHGSVWVCSWGRGVIQVAGDSIKRRIDAASTPNLAPAIPVDPSQGPYVVVGGVAVDQNGVEWFTDRTAINGKYIAQLTSDSSFRYFTNGFDPSQGFFQGVAVDRNGTKWLANSEPDAKVATSLYFFNESVTIPGTEATGGWGRLTTSGGLPNGTVMSFAIDLDGSVWVGTDLGVMIILDPMYPSVRHTSSFPLRDQSVQTIAVDAVNNKWVGTKEGVFVLNADGSQLLQQYSVLNTGGQLVDNDVRAIAIDQRRGVVYAGTEKGLSTLQIAAIQTQREYTRLEIAPNPFLVSGIEQATIRNLVANSTIKILSPHGSLVTEFQAQGGGRAFWNGTDVSGRLVPSGIYFVVAYADNGNQVTSGKIAVIRR